MWSFQQNPSAQGHSIHFTIEQNGSPLSYFDCLNSWQQQADFRDFFIDILKQCPFTAFRWETPPLTTSNTNRVFEFMLFDSPELNGQANPRAFAEHFQNKNPNEITWFENLGRDSLLIVPCPDTQQSDFSHLAAFTKHASKSQQHSLWSKAGELTLKRLSQQPLWLSTAGAGVAWLHVRLDSRPKYYRHRPYCTYAI